MEKPDMSVAQSKQIRDRFLVNARQHFFADAVEPERSDEACRRNELATCSCGVSPHPGKSEA